MAMVNVPHGLSFSAFTTTRATTAEQNDQDRDHGGVGDESADASGFLLRHFGERLAVAAHGEKQNHEILHATGEDGARQNPESAGKISELRGQHRPHQRARPGDRGEVMSEDDPLVGDQKVAAIFQALGGSRAEGIEGKNLRGDEFAVKAVSEGVAAGRGGNQPQRVDGLSAVNGDHCRPQTAPSRRQCSPDKNRQCLFMSVEHCV